MSTQVIKWVDIDLFDEASFLLRPVDKTSPKYQGLKESMSKDGFWPSRPIEVTEHRDAQGNPSYIIGAEGSHRLWAAREVGLKQVPVVVLERPLTDGERLERQIVAEATHTQARPVEFGRALKLLVGLKENKNLTTVDLAIKVRQTPEFVQRALHLSELDDVVGELVDTKQVTIGNALHLVALQRNGVPLDEAVLSKARAEDVGAFGQWAADRIVEKRRGPKVRKEAPARLRQLPDVKAELERSQADPTSPHGYVRALAWVLRKDEVSAAAEGTEPARTGAPGEAEGLRAEVTKLESSLALKAVQLEGAENARKHLEVELAKLHMELEQKDLHIQDLTKQRNRDKEKAS